MDDSKSSVITTSLSEKVITNHPRTTQNMYFFLTCLTNLPHIIMTTIACVGGETQIGSTCVELKGAAHVPATRGYSISGTYCLEPSHWTLPFVSEQDKTVTADADLLAEF